MTFHLLRVAWLCALIFTAALGGCSDDAKSPSGDGRDDDDDSESRVVDAATPRADGGSLDAARPAVPRDADVVGDAQAVDAGAVVKPQTRPIAPSIEVQTDHGSVVGKTLGKTRAFLGIPYARAPVGNRRWKPPQEPDRYGDRYDATQYRALCAQSLPIIGWEGRSGEDCLFVNVWTPNPAPTAPLPVMVYIHGGAYALGSGGDQYDGQKLSEAGPVVTVTFNYRLGALGFFTHPSLSAENPKGGSGNYGIRDQQAALAWVRANISAFGGDANNVTVFGESAGGNSVCLHLLSPLSKGLFDKAIVQSGLCLKPGLTQAESDVLGNRLAGEFGCNEGKGDVLACLRKVEARRLVERTSINGQYPGGIVYLDPKTNYFPQPTVDGEVLPDQPEVLFARGAFTKVPVIQGANTDEGILFHMPFPMGGQRINSREEFTRLVRSLFAAFTPEIERVYAPPASPSWNEALSQVSGDMLFFCPSRRLATYLARHGQPNYLYRFNAQLDGLLMGESSGRAVHGADIPYTLGNDFPLGAIPAAKRPLIATVQRYWTRFARSGDPNGEGGPTWKPYDPSATDEFVLDEPVTISAMTKRAQCDLWSQIAAP